MKLTVTTCMGILMSLLIHAQEPAENPHSQQLFYQKVPRIKMDLPKGESDGDENTKALQATFKGRTKSVTQGSLSKANRWKLIPQNGNNAAFIIEKDAPGITTLKATSAEVSCAAPIVPNGLETVFDGVKAHMPLYLPYRHTNVGIWQGYYYSWDNDNDGDNDMHGAIDYGRSSISAGSDPTFGVYAIAPGKVIDVKWSNGGGNIITIEHSAPDGYKYRSTYLHLRNGHDNDINMAKNSPTDKYKAFAKSNSDNLCWGTNSQTIKVKKNDMIQAGDFLAWAGNTGSGGIGVILNDDGSLKNPNTASFNVHLHFEVRIQDPRPGKSGEWVLIDPYGTYNSASVDCYDLDAETPYNRLFAPFYPSFHNVPLDRVNKFWGYYTGMGMSLQTISVDKSGNTLYAAGAFQWGLSSAWYARFYMTGDKYQDYFNEYKGKGYRPRQISVTADGGGQPRFSVVWEKNPSGENYFAAHNRNNANFDGLWNDYVKTKKWHVAEHTSYILNGQRYHAVVFVNKPNNNGFYCYYGYTGSDFDKKFDELYPNWEMKSVHVSGDRVGGVWRPKKNNYATYFGMSSADYQQKFNTFAGNGLRLIKVQSYADNSRFAAIWGK